MTGRWAAAILVVLVAVAAAALAQDALTAEARARAEQLFARYVALERAFDPAIADLYSDDALIRNRRTYPTGEVREATVPAPQYELLVRQAVPLAKASGDVSVYSSCTYTAAAARVRIACARYSELKKYTSPVSLLVGAGAGGRWLIFEELSESRP